MDSDIQEQTGWGGGEEGREREREREREEGGEEEGGKMKEKELIYANEFVKMA